MKRKIFVLLIGICLLVKLTQAQEIVARIQYDGGGDWYGNQTTFINIFQFIRNETGLSLATKEGVISLKTTDCFDYPMLYIAGHGNVKFSEKEIKTLRNYLISGGFLWADDDYGMDKSFRREMKKVFPDLKWVEVPFDHPIYSFRYSFPNGLPKIHEHDGGPPKGLALFYQGRMICFYSLNTDISDGCESPEIHGDPEEKRISALRFATNLIFYCLTH